MKKFSLTFVMLLFVPNVFGAEWGLKEGDPQIKSAQSVAFGPANVLFIGDTKSAAVIAIETDGEKGNSDSVKYDIADLNKQLASLLKTSEFAVNDLAVNPGNGDSYLSLTLGKGADSEPALVRIDTQGKLSRVNLSKAKFAKVALPNPPEDKVFRRGRREFNPRNDAITDLAYVDGKLIVSGLTNGQFKSTVREIAFPFAEADSGTPIEIFHGAHGRVEDYAAIRTFVPFNINGEPTLLAGYVCTPLVKFPLSSLKESEKTRATTIAELGNRNRPLDMIIYTKDGDDYILMANDRRGVMKISTKGIATNKGINTRVAGGGTAGQTYETIESWKGVVQLAKLSDSTAAILVESSGSLALKSVQLP